MYTGILVYSIQILNFQTFAFCYSVHLHLELKWECPSISIMTECNCFLCQFCWLWKGIWQHHQYTFLEVSLVLWYAFVQVAFTRVEPRYLRPTTIMQISVTLWWLNGIKRGEKGGRTWCSDIKDLFLYKIDCSIINLWWLVCSEYEAYVYERIYGLINVIKIIIHLYITYSSQKFFFLFSSFFIFNFRQSSHNSY